MPFIAAKDTVRSAYFSEKCGAASSRHVLQSIIQRSPGEKVHSSEWGGGGGGGACLSMGVAWSMVRISSELQ